MRVPQLVRRATDPVVERIPIVIASGVNRGLRWTLASAGHGYGSGRRAAKQLTLFGALIRAGDVVWDVGAHHGYVTLCAAARVGESGHVYAFEPSARNCRLLERHVRWNGFTNVTILRWALSATEGEARFGGDSTSKTFALGGGDELVAMRTAAALIATGECRPPSLLKIDVEGAEVDVLRGFAASLPTTARLLTGMHNRQADADGAALLAAAGFRLMPSGDLARNRAGSWESDPDLYAAGPDDDGWERDAALLRTGRFAD